MKRIALVTIGTQGDVQPYLALAIALYGGALRHSLANVRLLMLQTLFSVLPVARATGHLRTSLGPTP